MPTTICKKLSRDRVWLLRVALGSAVAAALALTVAATGETARPDSLALRAKLEKAIAKGFPDQEFDRIYLSLRTEMGASLVFDGDNSVALRATWSDKRKRIIKGHEFQRPVREVAEVQAAYFVGVIEGRLHITCPEWWRSALEYDASGRAGSEGHWYAPPLPDHPVTVHWAGGKANPWVYPDGPAPTQIRSAESGVELIQGDRRLLLPAVTLEGLKIESSSSITASKALYAVFSGDDCFLVSYEPKFPGWAPMLSCIRATDGKIRWQQAVWGTGGCTYIGQARQNAKVSVDGDRLTVFFESTFGTALDAFDANTGKVICRFCSTGYSHPPVGPQEPPEK